MDLLMYVLTTMLWLAFAWVTACVYVTIQYGDDEKKYEVGLYRIETEAYEPVKAIGCIRFQTAYLILNTMPMLRLASPLDKKAEYETIMVRISNKRALGVPLTGQLKQALSRKYNI